MREEKLNQYLNSEEFYEVLYRFKEAGEEKNNELKDIISFFTYLSIEFYLIVDDIELVSDFNLAILKMYIDNKDKYVFDYFSTDYYTFENDYNNLYNYYIRKFYKEKKNISDDTSMLRDIYNNVGRFEWRFHAFNSNLLDSIKKYGINPNVKFTSQEEIDKINTIFEKHHVGMICGWQKLNCEGKVFYSSTPSVSYRYGLDSPEWFSQFVGGASCYGWNNNSNFRRKDYNAALACLTNLMQEREFEKSEQSYVIDFFNKNWKIYAVNSQPMVAIIPKETYLGYERFESKYTDIEKMSEVCFPKRDKDCGVKGVIDTSNAMYVSMPRYHDVLKYFEERKKVDKVNIDIEYLGVDEKTYASFLSFNISILSSLKEEEFVEFVKKSILKDLGENSSYFERTGRCISLKYNGNKLKSIIVPESLAKNLIKFIDKNVSSNITIGNYLYSEYKNEFDDIYEEFIINNAALKTR